MSTIEGYVRGFADSWISPYIPVLLLVLLCCGVVYVRARTGSTLFLHERLWCLMGGKVKFESVSLQDVWSKTVEYEGFKFKTGIRFPSYAKIEETLQWLDKNKVGLEELVFVRSYFDSKGIRMRRPCVGCFILSLVGAGACFIASIFLVFVFSLPAALLTIKDTGTVIWVQQDQNKARSWDGLSWVVDSSSCRESVYSSSLSYQDRKVVCEILIEADADEYLSRVISQQRIVAYMVFFIFLFSLVFVVRLHNVAKYAENIRKKTEYNGMRQLEINI